MISQPARVIVFATDISASTNFHREVLDTKVVSDEGDFIELDAGTCRLAIHRVSGASPGRTKLSLYVRDVSAARRKPARSFTRS